MANAWDKVVREFQRQQRTGAISYRTFAKKVGIPAMTLHDLIAGRYPPTIERVEAIANALDLTITFKAT